MEKTLEKLGLIQYTTIKLNIDKNEFIKKLRDNVDQSDLDFGSSFFEMFSSSDNDFKGHVNNNGFKIRRRRLKMFQRNVGMPIASGTLKQKEDTTLIETKINGFKKKYIFFFIFVIIFYLFFIFGFMFSGESDDFFIMPFIIIHAGFMFGLPYYMAKKGVSTMKKELEKELFYIANK